MECLCIFFLLACLHSFRKKWQLKGFFLSKKEIKLIFSHQKQATQSFDLKVMHGGDCQRVSE